MNELYVVCTESVYGEGGEPLRAIFTSCTASLTHHHYHNLTGMSSLSAEALRLSDEGDA